ncbi:MAG: hypothetical protein ACKOCD_10320, partial [Nitrospiraceae bacterium]
PARRGGVGGAPPPAGPAGPPARLHAAVFSSCPLQAGPVDLREAVHTLFETGRLQGLLQLHGSGAGASGAGGSELVRGICWVGPLGPIQSGRGRR